MAHFSLKVLLLLILIVLIGDNPILARHRLTGRVIKVIDGDTFDIRTADQEIYRIRLKDIDCPERGQDFYKVAKQALAAQIEQEQVDVIWSAKDRNKRILGRVFKQQLELNLWMVQQGYAWHYKKYSDDLRYKLAESEAKAARKGLWIMPQPVAPWAFRQRGKR
jgi:micrococcal nuclease